MVRRFKRIGIRILHTCSVGLILWCNAAPALAQADVSPPMPAGYDMPGPEPQNVLLQIMTKLRVQLKDPYSVRDFILCKPTAGKPDYSKTFQKWTPARWSAMFALNAKNSFGGYIGQRRGHAYFRDGQLDYIYIGRGEIKTALDAELEPLIQKLLDRCDRIPDEEVQKLLR